MAQSNKMTDEQIKEFIFDDLLEYLEETGESNAITPEEIADLVEENVSRVEKLLQEMMKEGVLDIFSDEDGTFYHFNDETLDRLLNEMEEAGWAPPETDDDFDEE